MERLTERDRDSCGNFDIIGMDMRDLVSLNCTDLIKITDAINKLAFYENAKEDGKLLILPCAPGTTVYKLDLKEDEVLEEYVGGISRILELEGHFGDTVFFTREGAEKRLKELENNQ